MRIAALTAATLAVAIFATACSDGSTGSGKIVGTATSTLGSLVYVSGGDLFNVTLPDGSPERITSDGRSRAPRFSPTREWIAYYQGDADLWVTKSDGTSSRDLGDAQSFEWSPSDDRLGILAASSDGRSGLRIAAADGSSDSVLVPDAGDANSRVGSFRWSPDGRIIAYASVVENADSVGNVQSRVASLRSVSADGGASRELVTAGDPSEFGFLIAGWSGDGSQILTWTTPHFTADLADGSPVYSVPANGGALIAMSDAALPYDDFIVPAKGRDAVAVVIGQGREAWTKKALALYSATGAKPRVVTQPDVAVSSPSWSADASKIAYVSMPDRGGLDRDDATRAALNERRIEILGNDGANPTQLTTDQGYRDESPLWSLDGKTILFLRVGGDGGVSVWTISDTGKDERQLVTNLGLGTSASTASEYFGHRDWGELFDWSGGVCVGHGRATSR